MSDELIKSLERQISKTTAEAARHHSAKQQAVRELAAIRADNAALKAQVATVTTERDTFKAHTEAAPSEQTKEINRLRGELRTRDHREVFGRLAGQAGVRAEAVADLWSLSGYQAEFDTVDETALSQLVTDAKAQRPYLFAPGETPTPPPGGAQSTRPLAGPGGSRGEPDKSSQTAQFKKSELQQGLTGERRDAYLAAVKAGPVTLVD